MDTLRENYTAPVWSDGWRPGQQEAVDEICDAYDTGIKLVVLDAPTGAGKTVIGEAVHQMSLGKSLYVCGSKTLQDQFVGDFQYPVLKGRANYPALNRKGMTADECMGKMCGGCPSQRVCPYNVAKAAAVQSPMACVNTAYWLTETNGPGVLSDRDLVIIDEADELEGEVLGWSELVVGKRRLELFGQVAPKKGVHKDTVLRWLNQTIVGGKRHRSRIDRENDGKEWRITSRTISNLQRVVDTWSTVEWVRVYGGSPGSFSLKPVRVGERGKDWVWAHADRFLLMSATMIGAGRMLADLGWDEEWAYVSMPSTFPPENRKVYPLNAALMTKKGKDAGEWTKGVEAVCRVLRKHDDERVLVHTVNYEFTRMLHDTLMSRGIDSIYTYTNAQERGKALRDYKNDPAGVLLAPSMMRGVDLPDDLCRVQVIAKVPYRSLGDPQVSARLRGEGGQDWYEISACREIVQMTGRGVRHVEDHAVTYVVDSQFGAKIHRWKGWLPGWWWEGVDQTKRMDQLLTE